MNTEYENCKESFSALFNTCIHDLVIGPAFVQAIVDLNG